MLNKYTDAKRGVVEDFIYYDFSYALLLENICSFTNKPHGTCSTLFFYNDCSLVLTEMEANNLRFINKIAIIQLSVD